MEADCEKELAKLFSFAGLDTAKGEADAATIRAEDDASVTDLVLMKGFFLFGFAASDCVGVFELKSAKEGLGETGTGVVGALSCLCVGAMLLIGVEISRGILLLDVVGTAKADDDGDDAGANGLGLNVEGNAADEALVTVTDGRLNGSLT